MPDRHGRRRVASAAAGAGRWFCGPGRQARLTIAHCLQNAASTLFTLSMAGSIFFSVSPDAARWRVLLFLALSLAPFLVMAPLVGPIVDRVRGGLPIAMVLAFVAQAVLAAALAPRLRSPLLFPLAFGVLVAAKTEGVAANAVVPTVVDDEQDLVAANARISRSATLSGAVAAGIGVALYRVAGPAATLWAATAVYSVGAVAAWRVRAVAGRLPPIDRVAAIELVRPELSTAVLDMMALRAAVGFAVFHLAFSLRAEGMPAWVLGGVLAAHAAGGFAGTVVSPWLRRHRSERTMVTLALAASAAGFALGSVLIGPATVLVAMLVLGLAASVGRRALDATIQGRARHARRGQAYASLETRLVLAWVVAACLAVAARAPTIIGMVALTAFLSLATLAHLRRNELLGTFLDPGAEQLALPRRLLLRAETLAAEGLFDEAIVVARAAVEQIVWPDSCSPPADEVTARQAIARARRLLDDPPGAGGTATPAA
ncbi:MAG: hypothetical protein R2761_05805 [Acidimicrobiales bacterium]